MTKFRIVGGINILLGLIQILLSLLFFFFTLPRLMNIYYEFGAKSPASTNTYLVLGLILLMAFANLFLGFKLFSKSSDKKEKYFKYAVASIILTVATLGVFTGILVLSATLPIYSLTSHF